MCVCVCVCVCVSTNRSSQEGKSSVCIWEEFSVGEHLRNQIWFNKVTVELCVEAI
jgi:hypothetical protein